MSETTKRIIKKWKHTSWGDRIQWLDIPKRRLVGWMQNIPNEGDILLVKMTSGKVGKMMFVTVEKQRDPRDMFFAAVEDIGYATEEEVNMPETKQKQDFLI